MPPVFQKRNSDQREILIIDAPESFEPARRSTDAVARHADDVKPSTLSWPLSAADQVDARQVITRARRCARLVCLSQGVIEKPSAINRDTGWAPCRRFAGAPVAIDEDWSALRFRRVQFIKRLTRSKSFAVSGGKARAEG